MITVFLCDDHACFIEMLALALTEPGFKVVGTAATGLDAVRGICNTKPQVAVIDVSMPGMNGLLVAEEVLKQRPATRIIILFESITEEQMAEGLRHGVHGFLEKTDRLESIQRAIARIAAGSVYVSDKLQPFLLGAYGRPRVDVDRLSARERQVLQLIAEGHGTKEIAGLLNLSEKTIESHRTRLMTKLNIRGVAALVRYAIRRGWVQA